MKMNIPLKTLMIFGLLVALTTPAETLGSSPVTTISPTTKSIDTTSTSAAISTSTSAAAETSGSSPVTTISPTTKSTDTTSTSAAISTSTSAAADTSGSSPVTTISPTTKSTDTPTSTSAAISTTTSAAPETTTTGTFNTDTTSDSTDDTSASTTTTTQDPCASSPCIGDSTCEERFGSSFACICRPGLVYLNRGCTQTKVFPGRLSLKKDFVPEMEDRTSKQFHEIAVQIENALREILRDDDGYVISTVFQLHSGSIIADVQNFYDLSSAATSETVGNLIEANKDRIEDFEKFSESSACELAICDNATTTVCQEGRISGTVMCTCKEGFIRSQFTSHSCLSCPSGEKAVKAESCEKCPFGFSGFNCNDPFLLVVVVVSTVLGALLIIFIVALIVVSCRNPKGSSSSQVDFSSSYGNAELHKPTGVPRIPRANPDAGWKSNSLEMTNSGSNQALVTRDRPESKMRYSDYEEDVNYRGQVPPAYSGYSGRGVENGGVQNPYFRQDNDRMRRY